MNTDTRPTPIVPRARRLVTAALLLSTFNLQLSTAPAALTVTKIAAGSYHSLFLKSDGSLWGMGYNADGELGDGTLTNQYLPEQILSSNVTAIAAGGLHSLFLTPTTNRLVDLWAMGNDSFGQLGDGKTNSEYSDTPEFIESSGPLNVISAIAGGESYSLFLRNVGLVGAGKNLWAMGYNSDGQLGDGSYTTRYVPVEIVFSNVVAVAAGGSHSLFLKSNGSLWGMGYNADGELGDGTLNGQNVPEQIESGNVTAVSAGATHSLFLKSDGSLWGMGDNSYGQLGSGGGLWTSLPVQIVASNVTAIAAGGGDSLFLKSDGSLWAMGWNYYGQLGNRTTNNQYAPVQIVSSNVLAIAAGGIHNLFIKSDGSLWGMGEGSAGQLGVGLSNSFHAPIQIIPRLFVPNGDFEQADFSGWTSGGNFTESSVGIKATYVHSGTYGAQLGPIGAPGYLSQNILTTAGANYLLSFWLDSPDGATPNEFLVSWNGVTLFDETNIPAVGWTNLQFRVAATGPNTVLQFGFRDDNSYLGLDDITVVPDVQPVINGIVLAGTNLVLNAGNGQSGGTYFTLTSTNLMQPLSQWTPVATNLLDAYGDFTITATNAVDPGAPRRFFLLELRN